jgi:hypothetical protein
MGALGNTFDEQAAGRGLEAWNLAVAVRRKHGVEEADTVWDYAKTLESTLREAEEAKRDTRERASRPLPNARLHGTTGAD